MADPTPQGTQAAPPNPPPAGQAPASPSGLTLEDATKLLEETRKEAADYRTKLRKLEEKATKEEQDKAIARGEAEKLVAELQAKSKGLEERLASFEAAQDAELAGVIAGLPAADRELIPSFGPVNERLALARRIAARLTGKPAGTTLSPAGGRAAAFGGYSSPEEWAQKDYKGFRAWRDRKAEATA